MADDKRPSISENDLKLTVFLDTNILIDAYITVVEDTKSFLDDMINHDQVDLVTSDYVMWELFDFARIEEWLKECLTLGKSFKQALNHNVKLTSALETQVANKITDLEDAMDGNIKIEKFMDNSYPGFYDFIKKLYSHSVIANQDMLVLVSAHFSQASILLTNDKDFKKELNKAQENSHLPSSLNVKANAIPNHKSVDQFYEEWLINKIRLKKVGTTSETETQRIAKVKRVFDRQNVLKIKCEGDYQIKEEDYLIIIHFDDQNCFYHREFQVYKGHMQDDESTTKPIVHTGSNVTIKLPDGITCEQWMKNSDVYLLDIGF